MSEEFIVKRFTALYLEESTGLGAGGMTEECIFCDPQCFPDGLSSDVYRILLLFSFCVQDTCTRTNFTYYKESKTSKHFDFFQ